MVTTKLITDVGRRIATELKDLPPLRKGFVRVVHRTSPTNVDSITKQGLKARTSLYYTSDAYTEKEFWDMLANDPRGDLFGTAKIIMDMPIKEYNILTRNFVGRCYNEKELVGNVYDGVYGATKLVCPNKYIVGAIEQKFPWSKKCIELFRQMARKNSEVEVPKTDLRIFNGKRKTFESPFAHHSKGKSVSKKEELAIEKEFEELFNTETKSSESVEFDTLFDGWDFA